MIDKYINDIKKEIDELNKDKEIKKEEYDILNSKLEELKISFNNFNLVAVKWM